MAAAERRFNEREEPIEAAARLESLWRPVCLSGDTAAKTQDNQASGMELCLWPERIARRQGIDPPPRAQKHCEGPGSPRLEKQTKEKLKGKKFSY